ncbi:MAG: hypothetical protein AAB791_03030 [Patescibacteria group bacterium]
MYFILFFLSFFLVLVCLILAVIILNLLSLFFIRVPSISSNKKYFEKIFEKIPVKNKAVYDLGSGEGDLILFAAERGARKAVGFEISPWPFCLSVLKSLFIKNAFFRFQSFFKADLKEADIVYVYLTQPFLKSLEEKLEREFKGTVISLGSHFSWKEKERVVLDEKRGYGAFIYQI